MKKYVYLMIFLLGFTNSAYAGGKVGISLAGGVFETSAVEKENSTGGGATVDTSESKSAEGLFAITSLFIEGQLPNDRISLGLDWVPHSLESETSEHKQIAINYRIKSRLKQ